MEKIAAALGVTLGDFFAGATGGEGGLVVHATQRKAITSGWSNAEIEALSPSGLAPSLDALLITLRPGGRSGKHPYPFPREEFAFVLQGELLLTLGPEQHRLRRGDAAAILAGETRLWRNEGRKTARILIVASSRGRGRVAAAPRAARRAGRKAAR
jgi:quercetin dioxygenase-like cupin family protein